MKTRTGYLVKRGQVFHAVWTVAGKKYTRSTHKRDRREAEKELREIMRPFALGDEVAVLRSVATRIEGAGAELAAIEEENNPPLALAGAWSAYCDAPIGRKKSKRGRPDSGPRTMSDYEGYVSAFQSWMKERHPGIRALRDVTEEVAESYAVHLERDRRLGPNSENKHLGFLALLFRVLVKPGRITVNPFQGLGRSKARSNKRRTLTVAELQKVCGAASGEMRLLLAIGLYSGLRFGDAATLRWKETDLILRKITRMPNKIARNPKSEEVKIPIHPELLALLENAARETTPAEFVLPETAALYAKDRVALSNQVKAHFEACGIQTVKTGTGAGTGQRAVVEVGFHSLRHTFVTICCDAGATLPVMQALAGHAEAAMTEHYAHASEAAKMAAVAMLPNLTGNPAPAALPPAVDPLRERLRALAGELNSKTWRKVKSELETLSERA